MIWWVGGAGFVVWVIWWLGGTEDQLTLGDLVVGGAEDQLTLADLVGGRRRGSADSG